MTAFEIARKFSKLGQTEDACDAYIISLQNEAMDPMERMEAACYLLENGGDYRIPYTCFLKLYGEGFFQDNILQILTGAFYAPNEKELEERYQMNCKLLRKYPYLFRKDFLSFESLPLRFFPYDDANGYVPFVRADKRFEAFVNIKDMIISRNFFRDLKNPILAENVYSQYELEYLRDNVRLSEYIGRENHVYLHYADWGTFCSWLQVLDFRKLLKEEKVVLLIEDEISQYPIDFKARFGIDYSRYPVRRIGIREVTRMIWHTQLSSSNGGDFFNEIFDYHPNLCFWPSVIFDNVNELINHYQEFFKKCANLKEALAGLEKWNDPWLVENLYRIKNPTYKDILVGIFMQATKEQGCLDENSRIVPALFFQPHFPHMDSFLHAEENGETVLETTIDDAIHQSPIFKAFPYIKTFTPMRRFTTSYGSTLRFMDKQVIEAKQASKTTEYVTAIPDLITDRILNRTYLRDPDDRLYRDSVVVRFEDGKLNPEATFTKLAAFLDIPYTESMTYCSAGGQKNVETAQGNAIGFDPVTVYKTYDDYCTNAERCYIEYFLRDAYAYYGYDFQYYDGAPVDERRFTDWIDHFDIQDKMMRETWGLLISRQTLKSYDADTPVSEVKRLLLEAYMDKIRENRLMITRNLQRALRFVNKRGQPLEMTPMLQPDPNLLVQPLYH